MKKLMLAAAIVCVAAISQAASASWAWSTGTGVLKDGYNKDSKGSTYVPVKMPSTTTYLFVSGAATGTTDYKDIQAMLTALRGGKAVTDVTGYTGQSTATDSDGKILSTAAVNFTKDFGTDVAAKAYFYEVVVADGYAYLSGLASVTTPDTGKSGTITTAPLLSTQLKDSTGTGSFTAGGWYKLSGGGDVPEPTSGLLLLIGVAGMALRRRRA